MNRTTKHATDVARLYTHHARWLKTFLKKHGDDKNEAKLACRVVRACMREISDQFATVSYASPEAVRRMKKSGTRSQSPHRDHLIPVSIFHDTLIKKPNRPPEKVAKMLKRHLVVALVTPEEHNALNANYKCSMPKGKRSLMARYEAVNIKLQKISP